MPHVRNGLVGTEPEEDYLQDSHQSKTICNPATRNAAGLVGMDDPSDDHLQPIGYHLGKDFVVNIQEIDGMPIFQVSPPPAYTRS